MSAGIDAPPTDQHVPPSIRFNSTQWNADIGLFAKSANDYDDDKDNACDGDK